MTMKPRRPPGAAICETDATFEGCWGVQRSEAPPRFRLDLAIPGWLRSAKLSPLSRAAGGPSGVTSYGDSDLTSPSLGGAAICETVPTFVGSWEG